MVDHDALLTVLRELDLRRARAALGSVRLQAIEPTGDQSDEGE
jgi:hypothetical protein